MSKPLGTPRELFLHKLGSALAMEHGDLSMLERLQSDGAGDEVRAQLVRHAVETRQHIANVESAFRHLGERPEPSPCRAIESIDEGTRADVERSGDDLLDAVILAARAEAEHLEIAVYDWLIAEALALDRPEVAALLRDNLQDETLALAEVRIATRRIARETARTAA